MGQGLVFMNGHGVRLNVYIDNRKSSLKQPLQAVNTGSNNYFTGNSVQSTRFSCITSCENIKPCFS